MTGALAWLILGAWFYRWRGDGRVAWGLQVKRIVCALVLTLPLMAVDPWTGGGAFLLLWVVGLMPGWGSYFDMTDAPNPPEVAFIDRLVRRLVGVRRDYVAMSVRGLMITAPACFLVAFQAPLALILAPFGAMAGPVYYLAHKWRQGIPGAEYAYGAILAAVYFDAAAILATQ